MADFKTFDELIAEAGPPDPEQRALYKARLDATRRETDEVFERRKKEVAQELLKKGIDPGGGIVISANGYQILEEEPNQVQVPSEPPPLNLPDINAAHSYGLNPSPPNIPTVPQVPQTQFNSFALVSEISKHLIDISKKVEEIQNNQESVANIQIQEIYKLLLSFTKSVESKIVESAGSTLKSILKKELLDDLKQEIVEHADRESTQMYAMREDMKKLSSQIEDLKKSQEVEVIKPQPAVQPETELGAKLFSAFNQTFGTSLTATQEDLALVERVFDLALSQNGFNREEAARCYVNWLKEFKHECVDNHKSAIPRDLLSFVKSAIKLS